MKTQASTTPELDYSTLTRDERKLVAKLRKVPPEARAYVLEAARAIVELRGEIRHLTTALARAQRRNRLSVVKALP